ncbi:MAG: hypothetical protein E6Q39_01510 [Crocinitomicaceae bacterium]|nr:MAG: hypothetical protein E6Q39_01510 [Crocinitomicaceae bacterium]
MCRVCKTAEKNSYFVPCSHSNCCLSCANAFGKCLQCARDIV